MLVIHILILLFSIYIELKIYRQSKTYQIGGVFGQFTLNVSILCARNLSSAKRERGVKKEANFMEQEEVTSALCRPRDASPT